MALAISRKPQEGFLIGDNIHVMVVSVGQGDQVKLAITAPDDVKISRDELVKDKVDRLIYKKLEYKKKGTSGFNPMPLE